MLEKIRNKKKGSNYQITNLKLNHLSFRQNILQDLSENLFKKNKVQDTNLARLKFSISLILLHATINEEKY